MRASDILAASLAILLFAAFLGVLIWKVPSPPLILVCVFGVALGAYDFIRTAVRHRSTRRTGA
jgi:Kef-type K+ transport system membrane component KefB